MLLDLMARKTALTLASWTKDKTLCKDMAFTVMLGMRRVTYSTCSKPPLSFNSGSWASLCQKLAGRLKTRILGGFPKQDTHSLSLLCTVSIPKHISHLFISCISAFFCVQMKPHESHHGKEISNSPCLNLSHDHSVQIIRFPPKKFSMRKRTAAIKLCWCLLKIWHDGWWLIPQPTHPPQL